MENVTMTTATPVKDPVCGMRVDPQTARRTSEHEGRTYYFCSPACKKAFDAEPRRHLENPGGGGMGCSCCGSS
jgi:Cu+-exporting ATPase